MAFPRNSLRAFLSHAKSHLHSAIRENRKVTLVIGNESAGRHRQQKTYNTPALTTEADLDSLTSSLLYAYIRSQAPPRNAFTPLYIPLLNIPASDIALHPEFAVLFRHANISASHLITLDDLPSLSHIEQRLQSENTRWILADHNKLQGKLGTVYSSRVHGVIDHHEEENAVPNETEPEPRIVEKSGSCTSLVTQYVKSAWDSLSSSALSSGAGYAQGDSLINDSAFSQGWDAQVAKMALASILVDTANLTAKGKVEKPDKDGVAYLESKIRLSGKDVRSWDTAKFYEEINEAKGDIGSLSLNDILRKDYKEWTEGDRKLGISSVVKPVNFLINKAQEEQPQRNHNSSFTNIIKTFAAERNLTIFAIMTTSTSSDGNFQRELYLQSQEEGKDSVSRFEKTAIEELGLEPLSSENVKQLPEENGDIWRKTWLQKDVSKSRKQVAPLLRKAIQDG